MSANKLQWINDVHNVISMFYNELIIFSIEDAELNEQLFELRVGHDTLAFQGKLLELKIKNLQHQIDVQMQEAISLFKNLNELVLYLGCSEQLEQQMTMIKHELSNIYNA